MLRLARVLVILAIVALMAAPRADAQPSSPSQGAAPALTSQAPSAVAEPEILHSLPKVADVPNSLLAPAPLPGPLPPDAERPYFQHDPMIEPPPLPPPGWFFDVEVDPTKVHVKNEISTLVPNPATGNLDQVGPLSSATLNWALSPRFELGYRLPSGFGEFLLAYRFVATEGSDLSPGPDGAARLSSLLDINRIDLDYASREISLWRLAPDWDMRWRVGLRYAYVYFDSRSEEPFAAAAAGKGVFEQRVTNSFVGIGPHAGVEVARHLGTSGLALFAKADYAMIIGRIRQQFFEHTTTPGADGQPLVGALSASSSQGVPVLEVQAGLSWVPPSYSHANFFLGYRYEYWWEVGRLDSISITNGAIGEVIDQGFVLRAEFNF